ncbi:hypothetical protein K9L16_01525 [Candidatus Pacearchaeota archaeon]|nr:hypothetical protein [Candidatus Pacearchaeota archaeon]
MKKICFFTIFLLTIFSMHFVVAEESPTNFPCIFKGTISINNNTNYTSANVEAYLYENGEKANYNNSDPNPNIPVPTGRYYITIEDVGAQIFFKIKGVNISQNPQLCVSGESTELDFALNTINYTGEIKEGLDVILGVQEVIIKENDVERVVFNWDFDSGILNLSSIKITENNESNKSSISVSGINLTSGETKTVYMDRIANTSYICVIDKDNASVTETMISNCNGDGEYPVECTEAGGTNDGYTCTIIDNNTLKIEGLKHSAVAESDYVYVADDSSSTTTTTTSSGGGGGGSSATTETCDENWTCGEWQECNEAGLQIRACYDINDCGTIEDIPAISQICEYQQDLSDETTQEETTATDETDVIEETNSRITGAVIGTLTNPTGAIVIILLVVLVGGSWFYFKRKKH